MRRVGFSGLAGWAALLAATAMVSMAQVVESPGFVKAEIYTNVLGDSVQALYDDPKFLARTPDQISYLPGLTFGDPFFTNTFGENLGVVISGVLTAPQSGDFFFFVRSDNASQFFLNIDGEEIPDPVTGANGGIVLAEEPGCCNPFQEIGAIQTSPVPMNLVSGERYGFLFVVKEGTGADWGQVAMRRLGDMTRAHRLQPIRGVVSTQADSTNASVRITQQPQSITVEENKPANFSVAAEGSSPLSPALVYQWFRNDSAILGANASNYSIAFPKMSDDGAKFTVMAAVAGASTNSQEAVLTVTPDEIPPEIDKVSGSDIFTRVHINFSEPMAPGRATNVANYSIPGLTLGSAQLLNPSTVRLTTSLQEENTSYTLTVTTNLLDTATVPNAIVATNTTNTFISFVFTPGVVKWEAFTDVGGGTVEDLENLPEVQDDIPNEVRHLSSFEGPADFGTDFGGRLTALVIPPFSGDYVFFWSSTATGSLRLSPNESPTNKVEISTEPVGAPVRAWQTTAEASHGRDPATPENRSSTISLIGGNRYYLEGLYKDGTGAATFKNQLSADPSNGSPALSDGQIGWFVDPETVDPTGPRFTSIQIVGDNVVITWVGIGTVQVSDTILGPWTDVPGFSPLTLPVIGDKFFRFKP